MRKSPEVILVADDRERKERLLPVMAAADRLGISKAGLYRLVRANRLHMVKLGSRASRIPESSIDALIASLPKAAKAA